MAVNARVTATKAASTAYTFSVAAGVVANFACYTLSRDEKVIIEGADSSGAYHAITYKVEDNKNYTAELTANNNVVSIAGPVDARINKPVTIKTTEVLEYT